MARPKLRSPDQPAPVRILLGAYEVLSSSGLAVVLIAAYAVVLGWATYVESVRGTPAVHFGIYDTWWFAGLNVLLGVSALCAALIRFPWKRHQTGFLIVHAGILVVLLGFAAGRSAGINARLAVYEGMSYGLAIEDRQHFELTIDPRPAVAQNHSPNDPAEPTETTEPTEPQVEVITIPFRSGPFNWDDYSSLGWFPWHLARRDQGTVYDRRGIRLEVLDYYSDSVRVPVPRLKLRVGDLAAAAASAGRADRSRAVTLDVQSIPNPHRPRHHVNVGSRAQFSHGQWITFRASSSKAETDAFRHSRPEGDLGSLGQVVLHAHGKKFHLPLDRLREQSEMPLGETGLKVELVHFDPRTLGVHLRIHPADAKRRPQPMFLYAVSTDRDRQDEQDRVFGSFWFDARRDRKPTGEEPIPERSLRMARGRRIDILQGHDLKLYYRTWNSPKVATIGRLLADGSQLVAFRGADRPVTLRVEEFIPREQPSVEIHPLPFVKDRKTIQQRRALVRLSVDGESEEFWLSGKSDGSPADREKTVNGTTRRVMVTMPQKEIDLGFRVYLHQFRRELDPGTGRPSHYYSLVDFVDRHDETERLQENVLITLNVPVEFVDPTSGHSYWFSQASFEGPWRPGEQRFDRLVGGSRRRDRLFRSVLAVSYDPGRGLKYTGCFMIVAGMIVMYYMRAYFFTRRSEDCQ